MKKRNPKLTVRCPFKYIYTRIATGQIPYIIVMLDALHRPVSKVFFLSGNMYSAFASTKKLLVRKSKVNTLFFNLYYFITRLFLCHLKYKIKGKSATNRGRGGAFVFLKGAQYLFPIYGYGLY